MPLADVLVGNGHRKGLGDLDSLARSLAEVGLSQPVAGRPDGRWPAADAWPRPPGSAGRRPT
jgi:hypothetical protein